MASVGRNIVFQIKNADGSSFHNLVMRKATVDSVVMSLGDKITGDVYYKDNTLQCTMQEYVEYNGVKYTIVNPPTIVREGLVKDNSDLKGMTKYSFEFYHPMYILGNLPFSDVAVSNDEKKYLSQNKTFSWIGKPQDYINKINKNLEGTEWIVVKSDRFPQEKEDELSDVLSFDNNTIAEALKTGYETWGLPYVVSQINIGEPYYSQGKRFKVEFGLPSNEILVDNEPYIFQFGQGVGLKNNSRTPRNNKIITRIAGYGSENNIPYGYPQIRWYGDQSATQTPAGYPIYDGIVGGVVRKLIKHPFTRTHLMPSVYSQTVFNKVSPYLANGSANPDYNPDEEIVDYYDAVYSQEYQYINEINLLAPSYEIHEFADIKPELDSDRQLGIVSVIPLNQDLTPASQWDDTYDAEKDEYIQSYFKITLPQLSFDLYACASIMEEMQVNMRSGACIGCTFPIQVDWEDYKKNFYDANGNFLPNGSQRDLTKYPKSNLGQIDIIVQKETQTFGTLMPNIYKQPTANDLFAILGISMPVEYITDAEERLDDAMKSYMLENNVYYYDYPLKFDEYFLATHTNILAQIRPNSIIRFGFNGYPDPLELFVKQITVKYGDNVLPQYDITLTDNIEIVLNQIGQVADNVEKLGSLVAILRQTYNRNIWSELDKKLSKVKDDSTPHKLGMGEMQVDGDGAIGNDLSVGGDLSVAGDTELNGDVTIGASASNEAIVNAVMQVLAQMKSQNYVDDSPIGKGGWNLLSADDNGNSYMVIDKLFVRLKAIFNELEIRKISYAGGNIILSHAGSEIVGVKPLYRNGAVYAYRCYCKKDDGTTATENWWKVDDQAKCQTFNIQEGVHQNVENTYYWRKVIAVGSEIASLDGTTSEELYNYADLSLGDCDANSDIPKAGDSIIQMGNRTDTERQGFISLEVFGSDAPAFKVYKGVNGYNLNNKRPIIISPKNTSMRVQHYEIETDYGVFPAVKERGDWPSIPEHKCYYFDRVQHKGSSWLCTYPEGSTPKYTTEEPSVNAIYWKVDAQAGESAPSYTEEWYAWSNVQSVVNATTEPTPNGGWNQVIGGQGEYAYLWKKLIRYTWNSATRVYVAGTEQYYRMSGTNGTSISVKGSVATVADLPSTHADGDAYVVEADRHLYMWSAEGNQWLDIGEFKGEDGRTYYTHVAWATSVTTNSSTGEVTNVTGFTIAKTADDTTHLWMGVYVDENSAADPDDALLYTWSYTKGVDGASITKISEVKTYANNKTSTQPADSEFTLITRPTSTIQGKWLWTRTVITWSDTTTTKLYSSEYNSIDGANGQSINVGTQTIKYALTDSGNEHPAESSSEWKDTYTATKGKWLWSKITTPYTYSGGGSAGNSVSYSVSYLGTDGTNGTDGTSVTVDTSKSKTEYAISNSSTTKPTSWQSTVPASQSGKYLWTKVTTAFSDNTSTVSYGVSYSGTNGADGTSVTITNESVTYAVTTTNSQPADSQFIYTTLPELTKGQYLWVKSVVTYSDGNTLKSYNVSFLGTDGTNGTNGTNGKTTHFAYATSADGSQNFSRTNFAGATYIGTYSDTSTTDSSSYTSYTWTRWRGNDGSSVTVDTSNSKTEYAKSTQGTSSSSVTGWSTTIPTVPQGQYLWTKVTTAYSDGTSTVSYGVSYNAEDGTDGEDGTSVQLDSSRTFVKYCKQTSSQYTGTAPADSYFSTTFPSSLGEGDYLWTLSQTAYVGVTNPLKSYSVSRMGTDGEDGINGTDGYTTHFAYATSADGSTGFSTTNFSGATYIGTYRDKNAADSQTYTDYTWTKWKGETGATGKGISSVTEYYLASTQNTGITNTTPGFSTTVPTLDSSKRYLWNYELITYTDTTTSKTPASLKGFYSEDGVGIDDITNYYLATSASSGVTKDTSGWTTSIQAISASKPYLWNYEVVTYTDESTDETTPHIIGHYGKDGTSFAAQYAPNSTPSSSQIHNTWQTGDEYMRTKSSTDTNWSAWTKIVGENGEDGDYTDFTFGISQYLTTANVNTAPADISSWSDAPLATTDEKPYLWSKQVKHTFNNGSETTSTPKYIRLTGEQGESAISSISLASHDIYFARNNSDTTAPSSGWGTDTLAPTASEKYVWRKDVYTYDAQEYGRNLQPNTSEIPLGTGSFSIWADTGASYSTSYITDDLPVGAEKAIVLTSNASPRFHLQGKYRSLEAKNLTVSCWVKTSAANTSVRLYNCWSSTISGSYYKDFTIGTEWTHIEHTYKIPTAGTYTVALVSLQPDQSGRSMSVCGIKVEYGDEATDWCIAPEDLNSEDVYVWSVYGENAVQLTLDNEHEDFLYSESNANQPIAPQNGATSQAHLFDGATEKSATWEVSVNGGSSYVGSSDSFSTGSVAKAKISSSGLLTVAEIYVATAVIKVRATYNGNNYYADFTANKTSQDRYELKVTPSSIAYNSSETWTNKTISLSAERTDLQGGKSTPSISTTANSGNLRVFTAWVNSNGSLGTLSRLNATTKTIGSSDASTYMGIYFELRCYFNSSTADSGAATTYRVCDFETVEIAKTANGAAGAAGKGIVLDLKRDNYTEAQWNSWCTIGNNGSWSKNTEYDPADLDFTTAIRVGDYFTISGTATDSGLLHASIHRCTSITSSTKIYGTCTSHVKSGENGTSPLIIDTDNDADQYGTDSTGATGSAAQNKTANVTMYYGSTAQSLTGLTATVYQASAPTTSIGTATTTGSSVSANVTIGTSVVGFITVSYSGTQGTVTLQIKKNVTINADFIVKITGTCSRGSKDINFTVQQVKSGAAGLTPVIYQLNPTATSFSFNRTDDNGLTPASLSSQIRVDKTEGNTTTTISSEISGVTYSWGYDSNSASGTGLAIGTSITISNADADSHRNVWVELSTGDKETLPITKDGKKDKSGFSSTYPAVRDEMYALIRDNLYTEAQWNSWCASGQNDTWYHYDWDADWSQFSIGDTFLLVGYSTDSKKLHYATFLLTGVSSNQLVGICVDHFTEDDSTVPPPYLHSKTTTYGLSASESSQPTSWGAYSAPTSTNRFAWQKDSYVYTESEKGRNLLRGTADMVLDTAGDRTTKSWERGKFYFSGSNGTVTRDTSQSLPTALVGVKSCFKITSTSSNTIGFAQGELTMKVGYVKMSFWVKGTSGTSIYIQPGWDSAADRLAWKSATDKNNASYPTTLQNSNWTRLTYSAYIHTAASTWRLGYVYLTTANKTIYVTGVKVEYGDIPTDWSKAPEDYNKDDVRVIERLGEAGIDVSLQDPVAIFTQNVTTNVVSSEKPKTNIIVTKGGVPVALSEYTVAKPSAIPSDVNCNYTVTNSNSEKSVEITSIWTAETIDGVNYPEEQGYAPIRVTYQGQPYDLNFKFYCNAMGKFKRTVEGDVETSIANKTWYEYNPATGQYDKTTTMGDFIRSSSKNTSVLTEKTNGAITSMSEILQRVDGISFKVYDDSNVVDLFTHDADISIKSSMSSTGTIPTVASSVNVRTICVSIPVTMRRDVTTSIAMQIQTKASSSGSVIETLVHTFPITNGVLTTSNNKGRLDVLEEYTDSNKNYLRGVLYFEKTFTNDFKVVVVQARYTSNDAETVFLKSRNFLVGGISMKAGLKATGIDIEAGKIINTADQWECQNNSGVKTAWLDAQGNLTVRGVYNNLLTEINFTSGQESNTDKIFKYNGNWYLDVLRCGDMIRIKSLPSDLDAGSSMALNLPYWFYNSGASRANSNRTYTKYRKDDGTDATRLITADEMRQLVGKRMVIILDYDNNTKNNNLYLSCQYFTPLTDTQAFKDIANGCVSATNIENRSVNMGHRRTLYVECRMVYNHQSYEYCYVWLCTASATQSQDVPEQIDTDWT